MSGCSRLAMQGRARRAVVERMRNNKLLGRAPSKPTGHSDTSVIGGCQRPLWKASFSPSGQRSLLGVLCTWTSPCRGARIELKLDGGMETATLHATTKSQSHPETS